MSLLRLSRRERQIMDVLFRLGRATAAEIRAAMADPPSYSAVRAQLRTLEDKGHLKHEEDGPRYVYLPKVRPDQARKSALRHLIDTFFGGSAAQAASALLDANSAKLSPAELDQLAESIARARQEGR
jgi:BlaI family transcriptional regulator, penicillinase repressor